MGVQGLSSFLEAHERIYRPVELRGGRLLIDGANLMHLLYQDSGLEQNLGGECGAFEVLTERFVSALRACRIRPFVLLDGGADISDKKLETSSQRAEERIERANRVAQTGAQEGILPILARQVFRQTLIRLQVPIARCYSEADVEIAALAKEWNSPVLSDDSDFYIFDLPGGLLPIKHFKWEEMKRCGARRFIPCKSYNVSAFCVYFHLQRHLLPVFAALAGNDYVKLARADWSRFAPPGTERSGRLEGLLAWLKKRKAFQQPEDALQGALQLTMDGESEKSREEARRKLRLGMEEYQLPPSTLKQFFIHRVAPPLPYEDKVAAVPVWTLQAITEARLTADVLDVLLLRRMNLPVCVERAEQPSSNRTSKHLRQILYGLLLGGGTAPPLVQERDRRGLKLEFIWVKPTLNGAARDLRLSSLQQVESSERLRLLLGVLGATRARLDLLPPQQHLPVAVTCYWRQRAEPPPDLNLLEALLSGMIAAGNRTRATGLKALNHRKEKPDVDVLHSFNQWQVCLRDGLYLNQLLGFPLPEPAVARLFEGSLVHQLLLGKTVGGEPNPTDQQQFRLLLTVVLEASSHRGAAAPPRDAHPRNPAV